MPSSAVPLIVKMPDWPEVDRQSWERLVHPGRLFEDKGVFSGWSETTRGINAERYGQWLSFMRRTRPDDLLLDPVERMTEPAITAYIFECEKRLRTMTVAQLVLAVLTVGAALAPNRDWSRLKRAVDILFSKTDAETLKPRLPISAGELLRWGLARMDEVQTHWTGTILYQAVEFRKALMVATLIACPVRVRAFMGMTMSSHLIDCDDGFDLRFIASDMKDRRPHNFRITRTLTEPLRDYRDHFRPILLNGKRSDAVWITHHGRPMVQDAFTGILADTMEKHIGLRIRPHAFRSIAATSIAELDPEHARIIRDILGHSSLDTADRHYNRAAASASCGRLQTIIGDISRKDATMERRERMPQTTDAMVNADDE